MMNSINPLINLINPSHLDLARPLFLRSSLGFLQSKPDGTDLEICRLRKQEIVNIGSFFNSFFDYEFQSITGCEEVTLSLKLEGKTKVRVLRDFPGRTAQTQYEANFDFAVPEWVKIDLELPEASDSVPGSRLKLELCDVDRSGNSVLHEGFWGTKEAPKRDVKLGIVMCTFNNEDLCLRNLRHLEESGIFEREDIEFLLVDNGANLEDQVSRVANVHYIQQANLGGAGGFTRGILEYTHGILSDLGVSHLLLMDDDIVIEPEMILRSLSYQMYAKEDSVLGGAMMNLIDPRRLHEMGAFFSRERPSSIHTDHARGYADSDHVIESIGRATRYDYTAWWFCSFSVAAVKEVGLPYPLFIRRDDTEYGERLRNSGRPVYCLSGVGVWHAPFEGKPITWMQYFDIRNDYVNFALTDTMRPWSIVDMALQIERDVKRSIRLFDYGRAEMVIIAVEDFLKGPDILKDPGACFSKVRDAYAKHACEFPDHLRDAKTDPPRKCHWLIRDLKWLTLNFQIGWKPESKRVFIAADSHINPKHIPHNADFAIVHHFWGNYQFFKRKPESCRQLLQRLKGLLKEFREEYESVKDQWMAQRDTLRSTDYWDNYLKKRN